MIVTAHQPNFLPGASVFSKIQAADAVIWLDEVQYTKGGWTNRNRDPDGRWLTVPVERHCAFKPINRVQIGEPHKDWRKTLVKRLFDVWPSDLTLRVCGEISRPYRLLVGLTTATNELLRQALAPQCLPVFQSHLLGGHSVPAVADTARALKPISHQLAAMVAELGGTLYLSGPSGRSYLDERPFAERGIEVDYWRHEGPNPCSLQLVPTEVTR